MWGPGELRAVEEEEGLERDALSKGDKYPGKRGRKQVSFPGNECLRKAHHSGTVHLDFSEIKARQSRD